MFYEAGSRVPPEIRPLLLFYGMTGFAKSLIVAKNHRPLSTLRASHGLWDTSVPGSRIHELKVRAQTAGTFQDFNDAIAPLNRLCCYDANSTPKTLSIPSAGSVKLANLEISLKDIMSRIHQVAELYRATYGEDPKNTEVAFSFFSTRGDNYCEFRIGDNRPFSNRIELRSLVEKWRLKHPFLDQWRFVFAQASYARSTPSFGNPPPPTDDFSEDQLPLNDYGQYIGFNPLHSAEGSWLPISLVSNNTSRLATSACLRRSL
jgi:hypothetical protein